MQPVSANMFYRPYRYVPAAVGYGVSKLGYGINSGIRYGWSRSRTRTQYKRNNNARKTIKSILYNSLPAKHYTASLGVSPPTHSTIYTANLTAGITQGTGNTNRDGDSVRLMALKLKGFVQTPSNATGMYTYRILVLYSGEEYTSVSWSSTGLTDTELFLPGTGTTWVPNGIINPKAVTCLYDKTIDVPTLVTTTADLESFNDTIQLNTDFDYQSTGSALGKTRNLYCLIIGSVVGGVAGSTNTGAVFVSTDLIFK